MEAGWRRHRRGSLAANCNADAEAQIKQKVVRVFISHKFFPATTEERAHFILTVEETLLDSKYRDFVKFGNLFKKVKVVLDRRFSHQYLNFELSHREAAAATGVVHALFRTCCKELVIAFLPVMSSLLMQRRSFLGKNINCDEALRNLLGVKSLLVSSLL